MLQPGTKVRYVGHAYDWLKGAVGVVVPSSSWVTSGFVRVQFEGTGQPHRQKSRIVRLNTRYLDVVEEVD